MKIREQKMTFFNKKNSDFERILTLKFKKKKKNFAKQNFLKILAKWRHRVLPFVMKFPYFRDFFYGNGNGIPNIPGPDYRSDVLGLALF